MNANKTQRLLEQLNKIDKAITANSAKDLLSFFCFTGKDRQTSYEPDQFYRQLYTQANTVYMLLSKLLKSSTK